MEEIPYGTLEFFRSETRGEAAYYVYPAMTETIRLLEEAGMQGWTAAGMDTATEAVVDIPDLYYELENQDEIELGETEGPIRRSDTAANSWQPFFLILRRTAGSGITGWYSLRNTGCG